MSRETVSVVIPYYRASQTIARAVESVLALQHQLNHAEQSRHNVASTPWRCAHAFGGDPCLIEGWTSCRPRSSLAVAPALRAEWFSKWHFLFASVNSKRDWY
jgi:hypothetical protein